MRTPIHGSSGDIFDLSGRSAMVTGACGPIGRAISHGLVHQGAAVAVVDHPSQDIDAIVKELEAVEGRVKGFTADLLCTDTLPRLVDDIVNSFDGIDVLVNNAGINIKAPAEELELSAWDEMLTVNVTAAFVLARAVAVTRIRTEKPLSIINISSTGASSALGRGTAGFGASKAGLNELTRELAVEWAGFGIRVNAIQPCQVTTPAFEQLARTDDGAELIKRMIDGIPLGRFARAEEIVGPVVFLASDASSMVTGTVIPVDGGNLALNAGGSLRPRSGGDG